MTANRGPFRARYGPCALVAGASEGIGAAFARALAERGLDLVLLARRSGPLESLAAELSSRYGIGAQAVACDLGRPDLAAFLDALVAGREIGLLVYNAALSPIGPFLEEPLERHLAVLATNCHGPLVLAHTLGRAMVARGRGGIVLMSSMAALQGSSLIAHYAATRAYNQVLAEGLWDELRGSGVDVLACCAGATRTPGYVASEPRAVPFISPPVMEPAEVVSEALAALGQKPSLVPGRANRWAAAFMTRLLPRRLAVTLMSNTTRAMYPDR